MDTFYDPLRVHIKVFFFTTSATGSRGDVFVVRTSKLVETSEKMGYFDRVTVSLHIL